MVGDVTANPRDINRQKKDTLGIPPFEKQK